MKRTHSVRFKRLKKILKNFGLLWQALRKFNDDNGFFLSSGIAFNILINLIPFILLLLALVGTYLYNDQEVLNHIRAYFPGGWGRVVVADGDDTGLVERVPAL